MRKEQKRSKPALAGHFEHCKEAILCFGRKLSENHLVFKIRQYFNKYKICIQKNQIFVQIWDPFHLSVGDIRKSSEIIFFPRLQGNSPSKQPAAFKRVFFVPILFSFNPMIVNAKTPFDSAFYGLDFFIAIIE